MSVITRLFVALVLVLAACSDTSTTDPVVADTSAPAGTSTPATTSAPATTDAAPDTTQAPPATTAATTVGGGAVFAIVQVAFGDSGFVEVANIGDATGSFDELWLCQRPNYQPISSGGELAPGESVQIAVGSGFGELSGTSGEMGLYSDNNFGAASSIMSYVEWGTTGHPRSSVAVSAGIWDGGAVAIDGGAASITAAGLATTAGDWNTS